MFNRLSWRFFFVIVAVAIVTGSWFYSRYLSAKLAKIEENNMQIWVEAQRTIADTSTQTNLNLPIKISTGNRDIPIIETNDQDSLTNNYYNLDSAKIAKNPHYLQDELNKFKALHPPIIVKLNEAENKYYYGETRLQRELRYFPIIQLFIVALFIALLIIANRNANKHQQDRLWVGMAKETAHQLGTPLSSLAGWSEILKSSKADERILREMDKDIERLKLVSDRFAKIGSVPKLEENDIVAQIENMVTYMSKRAGGNIHFRVNAPEKPLFVNVSAPLFDWVIENLLKNALDAMDGRGSISIKIQHNDKQAFIDVSDTGKGIAFANYKKVFTPGFTTKKRGWGLGLALTKRIVEEYHHGEIFVKSSEIGKGTTFRIVLNM